MIRILSMVLACAAMSWAQNEPAPAATPAAPATAPAENPVPAAAPVVVSLPAVTLNVQPLAPADLDSAYAGPRDGARHWLQATLASLREQRDIRAGMRGFAEAFLLDRTYAAAAFNLGILAAIDEKWDDAAGAFEEAARLDAAQLGAEAKPQIERARLLATLERTPEGRRKRRYDESLNALLAALPRLSPGDSIAALAELGRIDPSRWEAPALLAGLEGNGSGYEVSEKFLEIAVKNAGPGPKAKLERALRAAQREVRYANHRAAAESAAESGKYTEAADAYESAWADVPARCINGMQAASARLLSDDTARASFLLLRLQQSGDSTFTNLAGAMLKELGSIEPGAKAPAGDQKDFYRDPGAVEPVRVADLIPVIDRAPLEIYSRPLPRLVDDVEPVVLLASLAAEESAAPPSGQLPPLGSPAVAGERPWSELKALLARSASAERGPQAARPLQTVDISGGARTRHTVTIASEPAGAQVYLAANANPLCETPCSVQVASGTYSLRTALTGYQEDQQTVQTAAADRELNVTLTPIRGSIVVETPSPAAVVINGIKTEAQSPVELSLLPGVYRIGADFGSGARERTINLKPGGRLRLAMHP